MKTKRSASAPRLDQRAAGVLLHPTSLPGGHGIGDLGPEARRFVKFMRAAGLSWWQMLPVVPVDEGGSPYCSDSAFAGNALLISLELLQREKLLNAVEISGIPASWSRRVRYDAVRKWKLSRLRLAFQRFERRDAKTAKRAFEIFSRRHQSWLEDYALFQALKGLHGGRGWTQWEKPLRSRQPEALARISVLLQSEIRYQKFVQYQFFRQWEGLRRLCGRSHIGLMGDIPIFVAHDSADVWANQNYFKLDRNGNPAVIAGVPPDYFSADGQLWGNPLYDWKVLREARYDWWIRRLRHAFENFDAIRLDHFIGFVRTWEVKRGAKDARKGCFHRGPGWDFFDAVRRQLGDLGLIAEDLGIVTPQVLELRDRCEFPGMRLLQFAFWPDALESPPHRYPKRCVVYTGTHDNDTTVGWFRDKGSVSSTRTKTAILEEKTRALEYLKSDGKSIHWDMISVAMASPANTAIVPMQDLLGLDSYSRMNTPGTSRGNWQWRMRASDLSPALSRKVRRLIRRAHRVL